LFEFAFSHIRPKLDVLSFFMRIFKIWHREMD